LATCFGIVKQSGGHIAVESEWGKGTTMRIYLPRVEQTAEYHQATVKRADMPKGTESILLVEDEPGVRKIASTVLRELGYEVIEATVGEEALRIIRERNGKSIDLLVSDVIMPEMNGKELADQVLFSHPETKVLFISGYAADAIDQHGVSDESLNLLQKPFTASVLAAKVREVLDSQPATVCQH